MIQNKAAMTLRQLLASMPFDDIAPFIIQSEHPEDPDFDYAPPISHARMHKH